MFITNITLHYIFIVIILLVLNELIIFVQYLYRLLVYLIFVLIILVFLFIKGACAVADKYSNNIIHHVKDRINRHGVLLRNMV